MLLRVAEARRSVCRRGRGLHGEVVWGAQHEGSTGGGPAAAQQQQPGQEEANRQLLQSMVDTLERQQREEQQMGRWGSGAGAEEEEAHLRSQLHASTSREQGLQAELKSTKARLEKAEKEKRSELGVCSRGT